MNYTKQISEESIGQVIEILKNEPLSYCEIYDTISANLSTSKASIASNYISLFLFHLMKKEIPINEFNEVLTHIYRQENELEHTFYRFFSLSCCNISLKEFLELKSSDNNSKRYTIWEEMSYSFYEFKDNKCTINTKYEPYLCSMCELIPPKHMYGLYSGGFVNLFLMCLNNIEDLSTILNRIQHNDSFLHKVPNYYRPFLNTFIRGISDASYEFSYEKKLKIFKSLSLVIENFEEVFLENLISYHPKDSFKKFFFDMGLVNFIEIVGDKKIINRINEVYQYAISEERNRNAERQNSKLSIGLGLTNDISSSLEVAFSKKKYNVDYSNIDPNKSIYENFVYLKFFEMDLKNGKEPHINNHTVEYLKKEFEKDSAKDFSELSFLFDINLINTYLNYIFLSNSTESKKNNISKMKI